MDLAARRPPRDWTLSANVPAELYPPRSQHFSGLGLTFIQHSMKAVGKRYGHILYCDGAVTYAVKSLYIYTKLGPNNALF